MSPRRHRCQCRREEMTLTNDCFICTTEDTSTTRTCPPPSSPCSVCCPPAPGTRSVGCGVRRVTGVDSAAVCAVCSPAVT